MCCSETQTSNQVFLYLVMLTPAAPLTARLLCNRNHIKTKALTHFWIFAPSHRNLNANTSASLMSGAAAPPSARIDDFYKSVRVKCSHHFIKATAKTKQHQLEQVTLGEGLKPNRATGLWCPPVVVLALTPCAHFLKVQVVIEAVMFNYNNMCKRGRIEPCFTKP